jgi:hypothetical protein
MLAGFFELLLSRTFSFLMGGNGKSKKALKPYGRNGHGCSFVERELSDPGSLNIELSN